MSPNIIKVLALESFDVYVFLLVDRGNVTVLLFFDLLGNLVFNIGMGKMVDPICMEIDQRRRELIVGVKSGRLLCYFLNTMKSTNIGVSDITENFSPTKTSTKPRILSGKKD